jgi:hypothetical protein
MTSAIALDTLSLFPPQIRVASVALACIALVAERLQVIHGIASSLGAGQDMVNLQQHTVLPS